jgi:hypothetical protein
MLLRVHSLYATVACGIIDTSISNTPHTHTHTHTLSLSLSLCVCLCSNKPSLHEQSEAASTDLPATSCQDTVFINYSWYVLQQQAAGREGQSTIYMLVTESTATFRPPSTFYSIDKCASIQPPRSCRSCCIS